MAKLCQRNNVNNQTISRVLRGTEYNNRKIYSIGKVP